MRKTEDRASLFFSSLFSWAATAYGAGDKRARTGGVPPEADLLALKFSYRDRGPSLHSGSSEETHAQDRGVGMTAVFSGHDLPTARVSGEEATR